MKQNHKHNAALQYAIKDWYIFPVRADRKEPFGEVVPCGHKDASNKGRDISNWWRTYPDANIGLNLAKSGLVCIDVDSYKDNCAFDDFIKDKDLPQTLTQRSASGGTHYIFKANPNHHYPGVLCPGVDVKYNGYILISPSTFNGNAYKWVNDLPMAEAPHILQQQQ